MKVALLISGHCRTFVFKEQCIFFKNFIKSLDVNSNDSESVCDVYLMLKQDEKIQTEQGLINLNKIITTIKPKYSLCFKQWALNNDVYYSQINMISHLVQKAIIYEKQNNIKYDYFIRIRPDTVLNETIDLKKIHKINDLNKLNELNEINKNVIYTSLKYDARGNDQFFIMNQYQVYNWFLKLPMHPSIYNKCPDYIIFNNTRVAQIVGSGLVRDYNNIDSWNNCHCKLNPIDYWIKKENFIPLSDEEFLLKIKDIIDYEETITITI